MKALIWKEFRENAKWAGLVFGVTSLYLLSLLYFALPVGHAVSPKNIFFSTVPLTVLLAPLYAGVMGSIQISGERKKDQWAFLMHRPVSRTVIFAGKAVAGLILYFFAIALPLILMALWLSVQKVVAIPFSWSNLTTPLQDLLVGGLLYFVGMLVAIRRTRWYGSRFLPISGLIAAFILALIMPQTWQTYAVYLTFFAASGLAAWGGVLSDNHYKRMPRAAKIGQGLTIYLGILMIMVVVVGIIEASVFAAALNSDKTVRQEASVFAAALNSDKTVRQRALVLAEAKKKHPAAGTDRSDKSSVTVVLDEKALGRHWSSWLNSPPWYLGSVPTLTCPPFVALSAVEYAKMKLDGKQDSTEDALRDLRSMLVSTLAVSFLFCFPTYFIARRARLSSGETLAWCGGTLLSGLSGTLLLLALREWPLLEECPSCGRQRSVRNQLCEHCGSLPSAPQPDATSIFESESVPLGRELYA